MSEGKEEVENDDDNDSKNLINKEEHILQLLRESRYQDRSDKIGIVDKLSKELEIMCQEKTFALKAVKYNGYCMKYMDDNTKNDREVVLLAIKRDPYSLEFASDDVRNDRSVFSFALRKSGNVLQFASKEIRDHKEMVLLAVEDSGHSLEYASDRLKMDEEVVLKAVSEYDRSFKYASSKLKNDPEFVIRAIEKGGSSLKYASEEIRNDKQFILRAIKIDGYALCYASKDLRNDREVVLETVRSSYRTEFFRYASDELKNTKDVVSEIISITSNGDALEFASEELKNDESLVIEAVICGNGLKYASENMKNNKKVVFEAVRKGQWRINGTELQFASDDMKNDKEVVLEAVKSSGEALRYASEELKKDEDIVLEAVQQDGWSFSHACESLRNNKEFALKAVSRKGWALRYCSTELRNDKDVVIAAVRQRGDSISSASDLLKNDKDVMLEAISQSANSFDYASDELKKDKEFILDTVKIKVSALTYVKDEVQNDVEFMKKACMIDRRAFFRCGYKLCRASKFLSKVSSLRGDIEEAMEVFGIGSEMSELDRDWEEFCFHLLSFKDRSSTFKDGTFLQTIKDLLSNEEKNKTLFHIFQVALNDPRNLKKEKEKMKFLSKEISYKDWKGFFRFIKTSNISHLENPEKFDTEGEKIEAFRKKLKGDYDKTSNCVQFKDLDIFRLLGSGAFGSAYLSRVKNESGLLVVKIYNLPKNIELENVKRDSLEIPYHPNVVSILFHSFQDHINFEKLPDWEDYWKDLSLRKSGAGMVLMKYHRLSLGEFLFMKKLLFETFVVSEEIWRILNGIINGVHHLYENKIVHRDLHCGNIFINEKEGRVWIGDFGCALDLRNNPTGFKVRVKDLVSRSMSFGFSCTYPYSEVAHVNKYLAPEIENFDPKTPNTEDVFLDFEKADLYSVGVIGEMLLTHLEFGHELDQQSLVGKERDLKLGDRLKSFVPKMVEKNPKKRINCPKAKYEISTIYKE